jgi:hypothetical protein
MHRRLSRRIDCRMAEHAAPRLALMLTGCRRIW